MINKFISMFLLCLGTLTAIGQLNQDCSNPKVICSKGTFHIDNMKGFGSFNESKKNTICHNLISEDNSYWLKWSIKQGGILTFTLDPKSKKDDLDFILYKINKSCEDLIEVRCMASGRSYDNNTRILDNCTGETGLSLASVDEFETSGCKFNDDNYLKFLQTKEKEDYILFVNNYSSGNGFSFTIEGDSELEVYPSCEEGKEDKILSINGIFPNPAQHTINVNYTTSKILPLTYRVLTINGKYVKSETTNSVIMGANEHELNIDDLSQGTYLLKIEQGDYSSTKRFIKQ